MLENKLFKFEEGVVSRWASYENPDGAKGAGGTVVLSDACGLQLVIRPQKL